MFEFLREKAEDKLVAGRNSYGYMRANSTRMGIPDPSLTLRAPMDEFDDALAAAKDENTGKAATVRKDLADKAFDKAFRNYGTKQCGALFCLPLCYQLHYRRKGE
jgi:hypothetical protein